MRHGIPAIDVRSRLEPDRAHVHRCHLHGCVVLALLLCASAARADGTPAQLKAARELFADASRDEDAGRWSAALDKLRRVAQVRQTAGVRYHVALCEERLGQTATALAHYTEALKAAHDEKNREVLELLREPFLRDLRAKVPTIRLDVPAGVDTSVQVDGHELSSAQWNTPAPFDPGVHRIEARAPQRMPFMATVTLADRDAARVTVVLTPIPPPPPIAIEAPAPPPPMRTSHTAAIVTTAGAVVLTGAGLGAYIIAGAKADDAERACAEAVECKTHRGSIRTFDAIALGAWVGAAALGGIAIVLWTHPAQIRDTKREVGDARALRLVPGAGSLRLEGVF